VVVVYTGLVKVLNHIMFDPARTIGGVRKSTW